MGDDRTRGLLSPEVLDRIDLLIESTPGVAADDILVHIGLPYKSWDRWKRLLGWKKDWKTDPSATFDEVRVTIDKLATIVRRTGWNIESLGFDPETREKVENAVNWGSGPGFARDDESPVTQQDAFARPFGETAVTAFPDDHSPQFKQFVQNHFEAANQGIVCIDMGNSFLYRAENLYRAIAQRLVAAPALQVELYFCASENVGLRARLNEEIESQKELNYTKEWPTTFFEYTRAGILKYVSHGNRDRIKIERINWFPMMSLIAIDSQQFCVSPYASPYQSGWCAPWFVIDRANPNPTNSTIIDFCETYIHRARAAVLR